MDLPPELRIIHEPVRLRILGQLYRQTDLGFTSLRDNLRLTAGNLASHATKLVDAGLVSERDALTRTGFEKRYQVTPKGIADFERYLSLLDGFLAQARGSALAAQPVLDQTELARETPAQRRRSGAVLAAIGVGAAFVVAETVQNLLSSASGSDYLGIGVAGSLVAALAPLERIVVRMLR